MVHRRLACVLFQRRERENSGISSRTPDLFELFYLSFFHFSTSSSSPVFLQLPLFSFLLHRLSLSFSLSFSLSRLHRSRYPHLPLSSTFSSSSSIQEGLHGTRNFSSPRHQHTQPPRKLCIRAQHTRERSSFSPRSEERPSTDGRAGTTDRISARTSPFYLLVDLCAESSPPRKTHDPEARLGRARAPSSSSSVPPVADVSGGTTTFLFL